MTTALILRTVSLSHSMIFNFEREVMAAAGVACAVRADEREDTTYRLVGGVGGSLVRSIIGSVNGDLQGSWPIITTLTLPRGVFDHV